MEGLVRAETHVCSSDDRSPPDMVNLRSVESDGRSVRLQHVQDDGTMGRWQRWDCGMRGAYSSVRISTGEGDYDQPCIPGLVHLNWAFRGQIV